ncbi:MAG TPA: hypothetical protein VND70_00260 [Acidimicrobiales bacterium]|nr:hypothetical protein [Acidimicrobiales bacterium]
MLEQRTFWGRMWATGHTSVGLRLGVGGALFVGMCVAQFSMTSPSAADTGAAATQGSSYAQSLQITPHEGALAVGAVMGEALAGYTGTSARAQSQGVDLGSVGLSAQGWNCGSPPNQNVYDAVPEPLIAESGAPGAAQGETQAPSKSDYGSTEYAVANFNPYSEADTTYAGPFTDPTHAINVSGLHAKSWSGVVNGVTEAGAASDVDSLSIGAGAVVLNGLHWEATAPIGTGAPAPSGNFTIGQVLINGIALPNVADLSAVQTAVNAALGTLGLLVQLPQATIVQGTQFVPPMQIEAVPNTTRDSMLDPAITAAGPDYFQITNGLENGFTADKAPANSLGPVEATAPGQQIKAALCQSDTPITVADITLAAFDGGGYFSAALGGVNASSSPLPVNTFNLTPVGLGTVTVPSETQVIPGALGTPGTTGNTGNTGSGPTLGGATPIAGNAPPAASTPSAPTTPPSAVGQAIGATRPAGFTSGGPLLAAGLPALALLLLLIEGDRRMMRRAQRRFAALEA